MAWNLSSWLAVARAFQLFGAFVSAAAHGSLTIRVYTGRLGLSQHMVILELLICLVLVLTTLLYVFQRTVHRSKKTARFACCVVCDVFVCGVLLAIITLLAHAGVPLHCAGMTRSDYTRDDTPNNPDEGYTTIRFSDEDGERGELDRFCSLDRAYYCIAAALVFTYIFTIVLAVLRIFEQKYTKNTKVSELLESLDRADDIHLKVLDTPSPILGTPRSNVPPPPPASEGIISRSTSLRSTSTAATTSTSSATPYHPNSIPRQMSHPHPPPPIPRRPLPQSATLSVSVAPGSGSGPGTNFPQPLPLDPLDAEHGAEAALVVDGMQHQQHRRQSHLHHGHSLSLPRMPMLSEEEEADAALVSNGMRPEEPTLPPYQPGSSRMAGHAGESNEMRLSEYVKGETRAQEMKDSGRY
ncbi:hypothetical protein VTK56DRAFT_7361 [Thermocarpiscus australiensis]